MLKMDLTAPVCPLVSIVPRKGNFVRPDERNHELSTSCSGKLKVLRLQLKTSKVSNHFRQTLIHGERLFKQGKNFSFLFLFYFDSVTEEKYLHAAIFIIALAYQLILISKCITFSIVKMKRKI